MGQLLHNALVARERHQPNVVLRQRFMGTQDQNTAWDQALSNLGQELSL
jgi:hypothetical protein